MKSHPRLVVTVLFVVVLSASSVAHAALLSRLGGLAVYDTDFNITWLADANLAASNAFGVSGITAGQMDWTTAQTWIGAMNTASYLGYNDWRLPTTLQPDSTCSSQSGGLSLGYNCTGSEMGHLFYNELGGTAGSDIATAHNTSYGMFQNVQSFLYWSGTPQGTGNAFVFNFGVGAQDASATFKTNRYAWAVRTGDVAAVPLPAAAWLFGSGLLGLIGVARREAA